MSPNQSLPLIKRAEKQNLDLPAAADLIDRFVEADLLVEITGRARYRAYQYFPYVRLFSDVGW